MTQMYAGIVNCRLWSICSFADSLGAGNVQGRVFVGMVRTLIALPAGNREATVSSPFMFCFLSVMIHLLI